MPCGKISGPNAIEARRLGNKVARGSQPLIDLRRGLEGLAQRTLQRGGAVLEHRLAVRDDYELDRKLSEAFL